MTFKNHRYFNYALNLRMISRYHPELCLCVYLWSSSVFILLTNDPDDTLQINRPPFIPLFTIINWKISTTAILILSSTTMNFIFRQQWERFIYFSLQSLQWNNKKKKRRTRSGSSSRIAEWKIEWCLWRVNILFSAVIHL